MTADTASSRPTVGGRAHLLIRRGAHCNVFHRPGSPWVIQTFHLDTPVTADRLTQGYTHLRAAYAAMPDLIGPQRLLRRHANAPLHQMLLVKRFIDVDGAKTLLHTGAGELTQPQQQQLAHFVTITRTLLALPLAGDVPDTGIPMLPDIIDDEFRNLAFDRTGQLRLLDTNELISTAQLYELIGTRATLNLDRHHTHAKFLARLLLLETLLGRNHDELLADPLYRGYLTAIQIDILLSTPDTRSATPRWTADTVTTTGTATARPRL